MTGAWFCNLPNGKRVSGSLGTVKWLVETVLEIQAGEDFSVTDYLEAAGRIQ